ncbi:diguanylate cyclase [Duganella sp. Leaf126]|uniref:GGDEF domain-containing protein n=1 Tax=Duganella sp. Leaf126 TaxID=1736266 RepID=UPI0006FD6185|nr:GGDEF domain-containing protein [Duganella sp. Leaf126]KQQ32368.1 diguanylate cyclase [Duganella sp. Leaf126]
MTVPVAASCAAAGAQPDLFAAEQLALDQARSAAAGPGDHAGALRELVAHYERLLRESRRLVQRSDRAERQMNQLNARLQELTRQLEYRASHDPLTGALNRGAVIEHARSCLLLHDIVLVVLDIDFFKQVNDSFGHPAGDAVIQTVVACLTALADGQAYIGRVGGEEFSVVWPGLSPDAGRALGERLRQAIAGATWPAPITVAVTASVGVSWSARGSTFEQAYSRADQALYCAKRSGRNCVRMAD